MLTIWGISGKAGRRSQARGEGRSISACLPSEYATIVLMVVNPLLSARLLQRTPACHSFTLAIQLTQNNVTPASRNFVTRINFFFPGIFSVICYVMCRWRGPRAAESDVAGRRVRGDRTERATMPDCGTRRIS